MKRDALRANVANNIALCGAPRLQILLPRGRHEGNSAATAGISSVDPGKESRRTSGFRLDHTPGHAATATEARFMNAAEDLYMSKQHPERTHPLGECYPYSQARPSPSPSPRLPVP